MAEYDQRMIDAIADAGNQAHEYLTEAVAYWEQLRFQLREGYDPVRDESVEIRMKTEDFNGLFAMFGEMKEYLKGIVTVDEERAKEAFAANPPL